MTVTTHQGEVHDYLGMIFDYSESKGKVMINMIEYIKSIINNVLDEITAIRTSLAADHLFTLRDESIKKPLPEKQAKAFHHAMAQLLFLSARARRDIKPATAFLTTRVRCPERLLGYLKGTLPLKMP